MVLCLLAAYLVTSLASPHSPVCHLKMSSVIAKKPPREAKESPVYNHGIEKAFIKEENPGLFQGFHVLTVLPGYACFSILYVG